MDLKEENKPLGDQLIPTDDISFAMINDSSATISQNNEPDSEMAKPPSFPKNLDMVELTSHLSVENAYQIFQSRYSDVLSMDPPTFKRRFLYLRGRSKILRKRKAQRAAFDGDWFFKEEDLTPFGQLQFAQLGQRSGFSTSLSVEKEMRDLNQRLREQHRAEIRKIDEERYQDREKMRYLRRKVKRRDVKIKKLMSEKREEKKRLTSTEKAVGRSIRDASTIKNLRGQLQSARRWNAQYEKELRGFLDEPHEALLPDALATFLRENIDLVTFEIEKRDLLLSADEALKRHLECAYTQIGFWKNMFFREGKRAKRIKRLSRARKSKKLKKSGVTVTDERCGEGMNETAPSNHMDNQAVILDDDDQEDDDSFLPDNEVKVENQIDDFQNSIFATCVSADETQSNGGDGMNRSSNSLHEANGSGQGADGAGLTPHDRDNEKLDVKPFLAKVLDVSVKSDYTSNDGTLPLTLDPEEKLKREEADCGGESDEGEQPRSDEGSAAPFEKRSIENSELFEKYAKTRSGRIVKRRFDQSEIANMSDGKIHDNFDKAYNEKGGVKNCTKSMRRLCCRLCNSLFQTANVARRHMLIKHPEEKELLCPVCPEKGVKDLLFHLKTRHYRLRPLHCEQCPKVVFSTKQLEAHKRTHQPRYRCKPCKVEFVSEVELRDHEAKHNGSERAAYDQKRIKSAASLEQDEFTGSCRICHAEFCRPTKKRLTLAIIRHENNHLPKTHACLLCNSKFRNETLLANHVRHHSEERNFACTFPGCGKMFKTRANLHQHNTFHQEPKVVCEKCGSRFYLPQMLRAHLLKCEMNEEKPAKPLLH